MTTDYWHDMTVAVNGLEVACHGKNVTLKTDVAALDSTPLCTTGWNEVEPGLKTGTVDMSLMQDMAVGSIDATLSPLLGVKNQIISVGTRSADGSTAYLFRGIPLQYSPVDGDVGALAMAKLSGQASKPVVRGKTLHPSATDRTTSGSGVGRQLGAVIAGKTLYAALHVLTVTGTTPSLTVKIQSDDNVNFTSPTDRITLTAANSVSAQWGSVAGAITDDYWRAVWTISGTGPHFRFLVTAGIV